MQPVDPELEVAILAFWREAELAIEAALWGTSLSDGFPLGIVQDPEELEGT